ncbi:DUF6805 domain-containing protein [Gemmatimonas aurantiaca]|uniref:DUF6805 domain-containing protein n=1 Tax=Gemmatimonas aurantiaca TaxID=173480 RepID=UPI00301DC944
MIGRLLALASSLSVSLALPLSRPTETFVDRRIVDTVIAGNAGSEWAHGYAGHDDWAGVQNDTTFRQANGWMRYAMTTFDDTEVIIACVFVGNRDATRHFDLVVEDSLIARATLTPTDSATRTLEMRVPFGVTRGRTNISVVLRGREGRTPALRSLSILQDHHEMAVTVRPLHQPVAIPVSRLAYSYPPLGAAR